jgi:uncharacterized protein YjbI with pentapeptide repeats
VEKQHLEILRQGVDNWNVWRSDNRDTRPDFAGADLTEADLTEADLSEADFSEAILTAASLDGANLTRANLSEANLDGAKLGRADLTGADLTGASLVGAHLEKACVHDADLTDVDLRGAYLESADLTGSILTRADLETAYVHDADLTDVDLRWANLASANLRSASFTGADLRWANLRTADLTDAYLIGTKLCEANLTEAILLDATLERADLTRATLIEANLNQAGLIGANLTEADLTMANLVEAVVDRATLSGAEVYGVSVWNLHGTPLEQHDLVITRHNEPVLTADDLEVAQFLYLLLNNEKLRSVIDTITSKVVLILGRFADERKAVLDALRNALRHRNFSPVLFDFDPSANQDITDSVTLLARMARFVVADLTDPQSVQQELTLIAPEVMVAIQPIIAAGQEPWSMFADLQRRSQGLLPVHEYRDLDDLLDGLAEDVIQPAEAKRRELLPS